MFGFNFSTNLDHAEHGSFFLLGMRVVWSDNPHCSRNNVPFRRKWQSRPMKKTVSRSGDNILINSKPILKKHTRYRSEKEFPTIWVFAQLCSFNRLEVMSQYSRCTWAFCLDRTEGHKDLGTEGTRVGFYLDRQMDGWMDGWMDRRIDTASYTYSDERTHLKILKKKSQNVKSCQCARRALGNKNHHANRYTAGTLYRSG